MFEELARLEEEDRVKFHAQKQYLESLGTLVKGGHHVLVDVDINLRTLIALDFSKKGISSILLLSIILFYFIIIITSHRCH